MLFEEVALARSTVTSWAKYTPYESRIVLRPPMGIVASSSRHSRMP
jgi:hypothetical protein